MTSTAQQYGATAVGGFTQAQKTAEEIIALGGAQLRFRPMSPGKDDTVRMVEETTAALGGLDIVVCNAGVVNMAKVEDMSEDAWT